MARAQKKHPAPAALEESARIFPLPISFHLHFIFIIKDHLFTSERRERIEKRVVASFPRACRYCSDVNSFAQAVRTLLLQINKEKTKRERGAIKQKYISSTSLCQSAQKRFSYGCGASARFCILYELRYEILQNSIQIYIVVLDRKI